jgi:hypothetical protein
MAKKKEIEEVEETVAVATPKPVTKAGFSLPNKIVKLKAIIRKGWLPAGHDGEFKYSMTKDNITCPLDSSGNFVKILTEEERLFLEKELNLPSGSMSHYSKSSPKSGKFSYWSPRTTSISIDRNGLTLDLSNPQDYAYYKVLIANTDLVAPSWERKDEKATYKYAIVDTQHEELSDFRKAEEEAEAWAKYYEMGSSEEEMRDFLTVFHNKQVPVDATKKWLLGQLGKCVRENMSRFMALANDPTYRTKVFLEKAIQAGVIKKKGRNFFFIGNVETIFTPDQILQELDPVNNSERYLTVKAQIDMANDSK